MPAVFDGSAVLIETAEELFHPRYVAGADDLDGLWCLLGGVALFAVMSLVSVSGLGGAAAVYQATGTGLVSATWLDTLTCAVPFAGAGLSIYSLVAVRASRPLQR